MADEVVLQSLLFHIQEMEKTILSSISQIKYSKKPLFTVSGLMQYTGLSRSTVDRIKDDIGYTIIGGCIRFLPEDVDKYIQNNYFKIQTRLNKKNRSWKE